MAGGESSTRFDSETYKKAQDSLQDTEAPSLEKQRQLAKEQEAAAKKVADDVIRSQGFAKKGNEELNLSRVGAPEILLGGFEDFTKPVLVNATPLSLNQRVPNTPQIPEIGAQGVFSEKPDTTRSAISTTPSGKEASTATPTETVNKPKDTVGVLATGEKTETVTQQAETAQAAKDAINSGNTPPDVMQKVKDIFNSFPDSFKKFFGPLLAMFEKLSNTENKDKNGSIDQVKDAEQKKMLDDYGVKIDSSDSKIKKLTFLSDSKVEGLKTPKPIEPIDSAKQPEKVKIPLNSDGSLSLDTSTVKTIDMVDNKDGFTMTVKNKDGSTDTYTIKSAKKTPIEAKV